MADYAIVIKAYSKIVCHALKHRQCYGFTLFTVYLCLFFYVRQALLDYLLSIYTQFFSVRAIMQCKFHSKPHKAEDLSVFLITFHSYSNRQLHFPHINIAHIGQLDFESRNL